MNAKRFLNPRNYSKTEIIVRTVAAGVLLTVSHVTNKKLERDMEALVASHVHLNNLTNVPTLADLAV